MLKNSLTLFSFRKVFPLALLFATTLFGALFFLSKPNESNLAFYASMGLSFVLGVLCLFFYVAQNRAIATSYDEEFMDGEEYSIGDILGEVRYYIMDIFLLVLVFLLAYNVVIPFIGAVAGGIFQVNISGFEFNVLTLGINYFFVVWVFLGTAQVVCLDESFVETLGHTARFMFDHCLKTFGFIVFILVVHLLLQFTLIVTYQVGPLVTMPIKVLIFAYIIALTNSFAVSFFAGNDSDFDDDMEYDDDDEYEDD